MKFYMFIISIFIGYNKKIYSKNIVILQEFLIVRIGVFNSVKHEFERFGIQDGSYILVFFLNCHVFQTLHKLHQTMEQNIALELCSDHIGIILRDQKIIHLLFFNMRHLIKTKTPYECFQHVGEV